MRRIILPALVLLLSTSCLAELTIPALFSDHMVVQRDQPIPVWGTADPDETVHVSLGDTSAVAEVAADGKWHVKLDPQSVGDALELSVKQGDETFRCSDVRVGEVWICSGQSNMAMTVARSKDFDVEKSNARFSNIRMFTVARHATPELQSDCSGSWKPTSPETVGSFSATAYFFGRKLHKELGVPIGLINTSWGGTDIAAWTSEPAQQTSPPLAELISKYEKSMEGYSESESKAQYEKQMVRWEKQAAVAKTEGKNPPRRPRMAADPAVNQNRPANLYNGMLHPLVPYGMRGAIWYQGERNSKTIEAGQLYATQLRLMIGDWRERWGQGDFPFITVQLPNYKAEQTQPVESSGWVAVRESELASLRLKNTGIAVTTDVGEAKDIHPKNKQAVGRRLALWALGTTYDKDIAYSSPMFSSVELKAARIKAGKPKPGSVTVRFNHTGDELKTRDGGPVVGFAVAGDDKVWHSANARVIDGLYVSVSTPAVPNPVAVRYAWAANPVANIINSAGLPLSPFRTDDWDLSDEQVSGQKPPKAKKKKAA